MFGAHPHNCPRIAAGSQTSRSTPDCRGGLNHSNAFGNAKLLRLTFQAQASNSHYETGRGIHSASAAISNSGYGVYSTVLACDVAAD